MTQGVSISIHLHTHAKELSFPDQTVCYEHLAQAASASEVDVNATDSAALSNGQGALCLPLHIFVNRMCIIVMTNWCVCQLASLKG